MDFFIVKLPLSAAKRTMAGYGLAMLMVFLGTTVLIGASMQMMAAPLTMAYVGAASQDNLAAKELAYSGMSVVEADLQSKYNTGVAITTAYTYPVTAMSMPQSPDALGGATSTVGSYSGALAYVNGHTALAQVTATVGVGTYTYSKLIMLTQSIYPLDNATGATVAYGLRKLRSAYAGSAIRVRRGSDNTEQDIGFDSAGALDMAALQNFLDGSATFPKPLDTVGSAAAAYSLRKLRTAYTGAAIRVQRVADDALLDIGFDSSGNLDVGSLMNFVGTDTGVIRIWYDQSGNARNAVTPNEWNAPTIVNAGALVTANGRPSATYDGVNDFIGVTFNISNNFSILTVARPTTTHELDARAIAGVTGAAGQKYLIWPHSGRTPDSDAGISLGTNGSAVYEHSSGYMPPLSTAPLTLGANLIINSVVYVSKQPFLYINSQLSDVGLTSPKPNVYAGTYIGGIGAAYGLHSGEISEVIFYPTSLSTADRLVVENNQARYYQLTLSDVGYSLPLDLIGTVPQRAYGLRKLRTAYAGSAIRVRRSSDNVEANIGFDAKNNLNLATLMNFCGTASCFVTTWYDQSTTADNAIMADTSLQPRIVNAGVLDTQKGRPALKFNSSELTYTALLPLDIAMVSGLADSQVRPQIAWGAGSTERIAVSSTQFVYRGATGSIFTNNTALSGTSQASVTVNSGTKAVNSWTNGLPSSSGTLIETTLVNVKNFGNYNGSRYTDYLSEVIMFTGNISTTERLTLESNQISYYNTISDAPNTGFVTKWYDQSGNGYDLSQPTTLQQPVIRIDNTTNRPAVYFDGIRTYLTSANTLSITSSQLTAFAVANLTSTTNIAGRVFGGRNNSTSDHNSNSAAVFMFYYQAINQLGAFRNGAYKSVNSFTLNQTFQGTSIFDGVNNTLRVNGAAGSSVASAGAFNINQIWAGASPHVSTSDYWTGSISEMIVYPSNPSTAQIQSIEQGQREFYGAP